jgi:hypothetical protein
MQMLARRYDLSAERDRLPGTALHDDEVERLVAQHFLLGGPAQPFVHRVLLGLRTHLRVRLAHAENLVIPQSSHGRELAFEMAVLRSEDTGADGAQRCRGGCGGG